MASSTSAAPAISGWSTLPTDVLLDILSRLQYRRDFFSVRCVCQNWRKVTQLFPLLVIIRKEESWPHYSEGLYDFLSRRCYRLRFHYSVAYSQKRHAVAYSHGYLITFSVPLSSVRNRYCFDHKMYLSRRMMWDVGSRIHLWNVFSGATTILPRNPCLITFFSSQVILSARPNSARCQVVLYDFNSDGFLDKVHYLNIGDTHWTRATSPCRFSVLVVVFVNGELLALTRNMELLALELMDDSMTVRKLGGGPVGCFESKALCWLGECDDMLLAVFKYHKVYTVYQWNSKNKKWNEINELGAYALFLDRNMRVHSVSISLTGLEFRKNCIYEAPSGKISSLIVFSLEDRSYKEVRFDYPDFRSSAIWFFPDQC